MKTGIIKNKIYIFLSTAAVLCSVFVFCIGKYDTVPTAVFRYGSGGNAVSVIQRRLQELGYYPGEIDGIYGYGTYEAVKLYQQNNGLVPDGIAGESTLVSLNIDYEVNAENDIEILSRAIYAEGRGEPYEGQVAIGSVILNRVKSDKFPNSVAEVVYQRGAFDAVDDGQINLTPNETAYSPQGTQ